MEKTKIKPVLQKMKVGAKCKFDILKANSVANTISSRMVEARLEGRKYSLKRDYDKRTVIVTRIS